MLVWASVGFRACLGRKGYRVSSEVIKDRSSLNVWDFLGIGKLWDEAFVDLAGSSADFFRKCAAKP